MLHFTSQQYKYYPLFFFLFFLSPRPPKPSSSSMDIDLHHTLDDEDMVEEDDDCVEDDMDEEMLKNANVFIPNSVNSTSTGEIISGSSELASSNFQGQLQEDHEEQLHESSSNRFVEKSQADVVSTVRGSHKDKKSLEPGYVGLRNNLILILRQKN